MNRLRIKTIAALVAVLVLVYVGFDLWKDRQEVGLLRFLRLAPPPQAGALAGPLKAAWKAREAVVRFPTDRYQWREHAESFRTALARSIGGRIDSPRPLTHTVTERTDAGSYVIENLVFETYPGFTVPANLYVPARAAAPHPAVLITPAHGSSKIEPDIQRLCADFARRGILAMAVDGPGQGERQRLGFPSDMQYQYLGMRNLLLGHSLLGMELNEVRRALDVLTSREDVDPARIGITGYSGGAMLAATAAALDPRISAAAPVGFASPFEPGIAELSLGHGTDGYYPGLIRSGNVPEIFCLIAPRPALVIYYGAGDFVGSHFEMLESYYSLYAEIFAEPEAAGRLTHYIGESGKHAFDADKQTIALSWFAQVFGLADPGVPDDPAPEPRGPDDPAILAYADEADAFHAPDWNWLCAKLEDRALARLDAELEKTPFPLLREKLGDDLLDLLFEGAAERPRPGVAEDASYENPLFRAQRLTITVEEGVQLPGVLILPRKAGRSGARVPAQIRLYPRGIHEAGLDAGAIDILNEGKAVLAFAYRGIEPGIDEENEGEDLLKYDCRVYSYVVVSDMIGLPLMGQRVTDLLAAVDVLSQREDIDPANISVRSFGVGPSVAALLAAALEEKIASVELDALPVSLAMRQGPYLPHFVNVRGILTIADAPVLCGMVAPRMLRYRTLVDSTGKSAAADEQASFISRVKSLYRQFPEGDGKFGPLDD